MMLSNTTPGHRRGILFRFRQHLLCASILLFASAATSTHAQVVDTELSAQIDKLEDVVKRLDFDQQRIAGTEYVFNFEDYTILLCGDVIALMQFDLKGGLALKLGGGVQADPSLIEKLEIKFEADNTFSGKIGVTSNGQTMLIACWNAAPWLTAAIYRERLGEAPPMEGFTYDEYEGSGEPGPAMRTASGDAFDGDNGLNGLTPEARTFLNTALTAVIGPGVPASLADTPFYQEVVAPVNGLADTLNVAGKLGIDSVAGTFSTDNFNTAYAMASDATFANGEFRSMVTSLTSAVGDLLPQASMLSDVGNAFDNLSWSDFNPCALQSSSLFDPLSTVPVIGTGIETVCDAASSAGVVLSTESLNAFTDSVDTLSNVASEVDSTYQTAQYISGTLPIIEFWRDQIVNRLHGVKFYLERIVEDLGDFIDSWPTF